MNTAELHEVDGITFLFSFCRVFFFSTFFFLLYFRTRNILNEIKDKKNLDETK